MRHVLYLAWRYVRYHWVKTALLIASISLIAFLPAGLHVVVEQGAWTLTDRGQSTPLLVGAKGSAVDLTLSGLYFRPPHTPPVGFKEVNRISDSGLAIGIPLHLRYAVGDHRIVGTTLDYADFRGLRIKDGRWFEMLGECVLGSKAADSLRVGVGGHVLSSAGSAFDVVEGSLRMRVVGILAPTDTPDDEAVLVDIKTSWVISGLAHGHRDVNNVGQDDDGVLERVGSKVVANKSVMPYTEITPENMGSIHFHGDPGTFPVDVIIAAPNNRKSGILLRGRYAQGSGEVQMVVPADVVSEMLATMFSVRDYVILGSLAVGAATLMTAALVFALSIRLRRREIETIHKIGGAGRRVLAVLVTEILIVLVAGALIAGALTATVSHFGYLLINMIGT